MLIVGFAVGVFTFEQTRRDNPRKNSRLYRIIGNMTVLKNDTYKDYTRYAEHCLNMVAAITDQEARCVQREMAAEWLRLADAIRPPFKSWKLGPP
jgi:hypothetical protein